jgi:mono/diheme cytochrome c family protein
LLLGAAVMLSARLGAADPTAPAYADGATSFQVNCAVCHGAAGAGLPSLAPPLLTYPALYAASPEGRRQLAMTVLYGLFGAITVAGQRYDFKMPEFSTLDDKTLAATLNFVVFDLGHAPASVQPQAAVSGARARTQTVPRSASIARAVPADP